MADYVRPSTLTEAIRIASAPGVSLAAGCTDLFPATRMQVLPGPVLDLTGIPELRGIDQSDCGWRIGAATTWIDIARASLPPAFDGLRAAAREIGSIQIQNAATLGGNLCNASPAADGVPCLLTLDAVVEIATADGRRMMPLTDFILGPRRTALARGDILTAIHLPHAKGVSGFRKLGARRYLVISIAMVAARIVAENGRVTGAALSVGACSPVATRLPAQEDALLGRPVEAMAQALRAELIQPALSPIDDVRADAAYRADAAVVLLRDLLTDLARGAAA